MQPGNDPNILTTGMQCDGGFVTVPANNVTNPPGPFTVECWVRPEWTKNDPAAYRMVIEGRNVQAAGPVFTGYCIDVNEAGEWEAQVAGDGQPQFTLIKSIAADLGTTSHVVLTCDGTSASLFINGLGPSSGKPLGATFAPNTTGPMIIGAGSPWTPPRMNSTGDFFFPIFPFKGTIQSVAIYKKVLSDSEIFTHFQDGSGKTMVPGD